MQAAQAVSQGRRRASGQLKLSELETEKSLGLTKCLIHLASCFASHPELDVMNPAL